MGEARRVMDAMTDATLRSDLEAAANLYAPDAVIVTPDQGELRGREQIVGYLKEISDAFPDNSYEPAYKHESGDTAIDEGYFVGTKYRAAVPAHRAERSGNRQGGKGPHLRHRDGPERGHHQPPVLLRPGGPPWPTRVAA